MEIGHGTEKTLLCVDDDQVVLFYLEAILGRRFRVLTARDGQAGLRMLEQNRVDWVVVDFQLPDCDGTEFINRARRVSEQARYVLLSGLEVGKIDWEGLHGASVDACFRKPLEPNGFIRWFESMAENGAGSKARC